MAFLVISKKLLKYFSGIAYFVFLTKLFPLTKPSVFPTRPALYLNDSDQAVIKSSLLAGTSSLLIYHKLPDVSE